MGKIVFWIAVFFVVLLVVRLVNVAAAKKRRGEADAPRTKREELPAEPTVRCVECGTYLPKSEALPAPGGYRCPEPGCVRRN